MNSLTFFDRLRRNALLLTFSSAAILSAASCNNDPNTLILDDEVPVVTTPASTTASPEVATATPSELSESTSKQPKFDAKGVSVDFTGCEVFNGFKSATEETRAERLKVVRGSGPLTAAGLEVFAKLPALVEFLWVDARLDDSIETQTAFQAFASNPNLKKIRLTSLSNHEGAFPDYVLTALASTPKLVDLDISGSNVTAADFANVDFQTGFRKLEKINLYQTRLGDDAVAILTPLASRLTSLNLDDLAVTNATAKTLPLFNRLTFLHVGRSQLDDDAIDELAKLKTLEKIHVTRSNITESGANRLREALPQCVVVSVVEN